MKRDTTELAEAPFLDVVTNLIGILIIIIMVTGPRATVAMVDAVIEAKTASAAKSATPDALQAAQSAAAAIENDIHTIDRKLKEQQLEIDYRRNERDKFLALVTVIEKRLAEEQQQLGSAARGQLDTKQKLQSVQDELQDLRAARTSLASEPAKPTVIEHCPTPIAKSVFGQEVHFRLAGGRLAYVPWDELVDALKADAPNRVHRLRDTDRITETLGPEHDFRMEYTLRRANRLTGVGARGVAVQQAIELERFVLIPLHEGIGEPVERAFDQDSQLRIMLSRYDPKRATVTVWVYPDSFGQFRTLKNKLAELGFLTSGRPMPADQPIGGSPEGSRSAAQ